MPTHDHLCRRCNVVEERFVPRSELDAQQVHVCGEPMERVFTAFPFTFIGPDVCYDSPIDGRHVTSRQARIEDLKRSGCIAYDPEMKTDYMRRIKESEAALERSVEATVDREIAQMPARKREKLEAELQGGMSAEIERRTANAKPIAVDIQR